MPKPKNTHEQEDKQFKEQLTGYERRIGDFYEKIRTDDDPVQLINLIESKEIHCDDKDGLGMCPLIFAVDCGFDIKVVKQLVELGCDPYGVDDNGDTLLHYAVNLENKELEDFLLTEYNFDKGIKNNDDMTAYQ